MRIASIRFAAAGRAVVLGIVLGAIALKAGVAQDQSADAETPPEFEVVPAYEEQLLRLSEILGALHFLRALCESGDALVWKNEMKTLLDAEDPGPQRRDRLIARFNFGFETYHAVYKSCTPAARTAIANYLAEGEKISAEVRLRYGQ